MHLMILQPYTRVPVLPASDKIFGFFVFRNKKNRAAVPGNLTFQCKEAIICVSCHNEPVN